jgi:outer membrane protein OmpA-like peptidoglycan-associated protein/tetratricopeptide (TPR) repeat protein
VLVSIEGFGQSTNISTFFHSNQKKADLLFSQRAYRNALVIYQRMVDKDESALYAKQQIAECYVKLNDLFTAQTWYQALMKEPNVTDETKFKYAQVLYITQRYDEAIEILKSINKKKVDSLLVEKQIHFLKNIEFYKHDTAFSVIEAKPINTIHSDFGATYYKGDVVFASTRDYDLFIKRKSISAPTPEESLSHLYWADYAKAEGTAGNYGEVKSFKGESLKSFHNDGPITFWDQGRKVAITSNNLSGQKLAVSESGITNLKLYLAEMGALGTLKNITPFPYNSENYSIAHATFTKNGDRIYFSANYPNGYGGSDIYYCDYVNDGWSIMTNAGPAINTAGDELYPFLENDSTLFFTSNGHGGFGGLDVYTSKRRHGKFEFVRNLGTPINSPYDDFSMVTDSTGREGFFTSNRFNGTGSDDIYFLKANYIFLQGFTRDLDSLNRVIPGTTITLKDDKGNVIATAISNDQGMFEIKLPFDKDLVLSAEKKGYTGLGDLGLSTKGLAFSIDSLMVPLRKQRDIIAKGKIYSNETHKIIPEVTMRLKNLTENKIDSIKLGANGEYAMTLKSDHSYKIEASKEGYITNGFDMNTINVKRDTLLNDIVLEESYVDKVVIHFDYAKNTIRADSRMELDKIIRNLKKFKETTIQISAHADSRGPKPYNQALSDGRAKAALDYIVSRGISKTRIEARGFGEELLLNRCSDGVTCTEVEHSLNRRAEVKVQKKQ